MINLKSAEAQKSYRIRFRVLGGGVAPGDEAKILALSGQQLAQRTPLRVLKRRADLTRMRSAQLVVRQVEGNEMELDVRAESGTYIKELVHSDEGRTSPSVAGVLGKKCEVLWLDVMQVHSQ